MKSFYDIYEGRGEVIDYDMIDTFLSQFDFSEIAKMSEDFDGIEEDDLFHTLATLPAIPDEYSDMLLEGLYDIGAVSVLDWLEDCYPVRWQMQRVVQYTLLPDENVW